MKNKKQGGKQQAKVFRPKKAINKRNKVEIKFDPNARKYADHVDIVIF